MLDPTKDNDIIVKETFKPGLGGILILISGLLALTTGVYSIQDPELMAELYAEVKVNLSIEIIEAFGYVQVIFGIVAIVGGLFAMWGARYWALAFAGGFLGFVASGGIFLGTFVGLIGLILVAISRKEFRS
jgi:hypothetical protein